MIRVDQKRLKIFKEASSRKLGEVGDGGNSKGLLTFRKMSFRWPVSDQSFMKAHDEAGGLAGPTRPSGSSFWVQPRFRQ